MIASIGVRFKNIFPALTHRNFRLFWFGQCISLVGTWMQSIGQSWLVLQLTQSSFRLGVVNALQFPPVMLLSLFAGTFVDKFSKRKVLLFTQSCLMILAAVFASLTYFKIIKYEYILVLATMLGIVNTLDMPTRQSFFIELVGKEDLMNAIALNSTIFNLARVIGPAVAGILIGILGIGICFFLNALSFVAVIAGIWMIQIPKKDLTNRKSIEIRGIIGEIKDGLNYVSHNTMIFLPLILLGILSMFVMNYSVLVPVLAKQNLGQNALGYGALMASMGIGSLIGALTLAARSRKGPRIWALLAGSLGASIFTLSLGFFKYYLAALVLLMVIGFCLITFTTMVNTSIQLNSSDNMRGRVMSIFSLVFGGVTPIGSMFAGTTSEYIGAPLCFIGSGLIGIVATAIIAAIMARYRGYREIP